MLLFFILISTLTTQLQFTTEFSITWGKYLFIACRHTCCSYFVCAWWYPL